MNIADLLPTSLNVSTTGTEIIVYPNLARSDSGINYQLSVGSFLAVTLPIALSTSETNTFIHCDKNTTFTVGKIFNLNVSRLQ